MNSILGYANTASLPVPVTMQGPPMQLPPNAGASNPAYPTNLFQTPVVTAQTIPSSLVPMRGSGGGGGSMSTENPGSAQLKASKSHSSGPMSSSSAGKAGTLERNFPGSTATTNMCLFIGVPLEYSLNELINTLKQTRDIEDPISAEVMRSGEIEYFKMEFPPDRVKTLLLTSLKIQEQPIIILPFMFEKDIKEMLKYHQLQVESDRPMDRIGIHLYFSTYGDIAEIVEFSSTSFCIFFALVKSVKTIQSKYREQIPIHFPDNTMIILTIVNFSHDHYANYLVRKPLSKCISRCVKNKMSDVMNRMGGGGGGGVGGGVQGSSQPSANTSNTRNYSTKKSDTTPPPPPIISEAGNNPNMRSIPSSGSNTNASVANVTKTQVYPVQSAQIPVSHNPGLSQTQRSLTAQPQMGPPHASMPMNNDIRRYSNYPMEGGSSMGAMPHQGNKHMGNDGENRMRNRIHRDDNRQRRDHNNSSNQGNNGNMRRDYQNRNNQR
eukprot:TRINITY_DN1416_c0_g1_i19.p1 TRINITY_DN1416_c0_g1~~TRINITY_DN1416_c0_g1_i19.p1  ORF type:complete len:493 (-),score=70.28 TRINITY_DN1416_c0_g1_i19:252-1730(-)